MSFSLVEMWNDGGSGPLVRFVLLLMGIASVSIVIERFWALRGLSALDALRVMGRMARQEGISRVERRWMLQRVARSIEHDLGRGLGSLLTVALTDSASPGAIALGLAEALVPFALGLLVGVPTLWAYAYFRGKRDRVTIVVESVLLAGELD